MRFQDKYLPYQDSMRYLYKGDNFDYDLYKHIKRYAKVIDPYKEFSITVPKEFTQEEKGSNPIVLALL